MAGQVTFHCLEYLSICDIPLAVSTAGRGVSSETPAFFTSLRMRTYIHVDGFYLYHGALKDTPWKSLNRVA